MNNQEHEYGCTTCQVNFNIERLIDFERSVKATFIPLKIRRTKKIGQIFTVNSILFGWHVAHGSHHDGYAI